MKDISQQTRWFDLFFYVTIIMFFLSVTTTIWKISGQDDHMQSHSIADITINLTGQPVREHCTSCHPAGQLALPQLHNNHRDQQKTGHPDIAPHLSEDIGCTGCHFGEGMAVKIAVSHGLPGMGGRAVLKKQDVQASCFTCHELGPLKGAEKAVKGFQLFFAKGCDTCHYVDNLGLAGRYGPDLSTIGSFFGLKNIQESISNPKKEPVNSIMPRFPLSPTQIKTISYFLKSRIQNPAHVTPMRKKANTVKKKVSSATGEVTGTILFEEKKCLACHKYQDADGRVATDLTFIAQIRSKDYLRDFLRNPQSMVPGAIMPVIPMTAGEEEKLLTFLTSKNKFNLHKRDAKNLYMTFCQRCHAADGNGKGTIYENLSGFPRPFSENSDFYTSIPDTRIIKSIENGIPGTAMPPYKNLLSSAELDEMINVIFDSFILVARYDKIKTFPLPPRRKETTSSAQTDSLYNKNCRSCHGKAGTGTGPEYLKHSPRPRDFTNNNFFDEISDERIARSIYHGIPGTSMPSFKSVFLDRELWNMVAKIRMFSKNND